MSGRIGNGAEYNLGGNGYVEDGVGVGDEEGGEEGGGKKCSIGSKLKLVRKNRVRENRVRENSGKRSAPQKYIARCTQDDNHGGAIHKKIRRN